VTEPQFDPITGLPIDVSTSSVFTIPLNSQPLLAPEWAPQGQPPDGQYPDRIPTVFGTLQAHNNAVPRTVQSLSTDGNKNLNVNIAAGGSSSSAPTATINTASNLAAWNSSDTGSERVLSSFNFTFGGHDHVFGVSFSITFICHAADGHNMYIYLGGNSSLDTAHAINLWGYSTFGGSDLTDGTQVTVADTIMFPYPLTCALAWPNSNLARIVGYSDRTEFLGSGTIYGGTIP